MINDQIDDWEEIPVDEIDDWEEIPQTPVASKAESGLRGAAQGASLGFADELAGAAGYLGGKLGVVPEMGYDYYRDYARRGDVAAEAANPKSFGAGALGGSVLSAAIPGAQLAAGAKLAPTIGAAALQGGLAGAGTTEESLLSQGGLADVAKGAGFGAAGGAAGYGLGQAISKGSQMLGRGSEAAAEGLESTAERLAARTIGAERGTIKKLGDEKVREAGRYAIDEGIVSPFASTDEMMERNLARQSAAGKQMGDVYSQIDEAGTSTFNPLDVASKVDEKIGGFWRSPLNKGETSQLENTLEAIMMRGEQPISLREAQRLKEELGKVANWKNNVSITDKERMARDAYGVVSSEIDAAVEQGAKAIGTEGLRDSLQQAKSAFSKSKTAEELLTNKQAREQGNKLFGLTDTIAGAGGLTGGVGMSAAVLGGKKLLDRYGTSTAAVGADKLADIVRMAPEKLGKFAPVLQQAAQRGSQGLAATHFILQQTNPEYQKQLLDMTESN